MDTPTQQKIEKSTSLGALAKALAIFQGEVETVAKNSTNPFFKSKYANLEDIIKTIRTPLAKNGLSVTQFPVDEGELTTLLMHSSGEYIQASYKMRPKDNTPQGVGSALSYMRRYAISAILSIATGEGEDDGNAASASEPRTRIVKHIQHQDYHGEDVVQVDEPPKKTKDALKTEISASLEKLGQKGKTKPQIQAFIKDVTKLDPADEKNYQEIADRLSILASEKFDE